MAELVAMGHEVTAMGGGERAYIERVHSIAALKGPDLRRYRRNDLAAIREFDCVVIAGGEQIQDGRFNNHLRGLLLNVFAVWAAATMLDIPVFFWSVGARPFRNPLSVGALRLMGVNSPFVVRDTQSLEIIGRAIGKRVYLAADPVFTLPPVRRPDTPPGADPYILVVPAYDKRVARSYAEPLLDGVVTAARNAGLSVRVIITDLQRGYDEILLNSGSFRARNGIVVDRDVITPTQLVSVVASAAIVVSARLHPLIVASTQAVPHVVVSRSGKMDDFAKDTLAPVIQTADVRAAAIVDAIDLELASRRTEQPPFESAIRNLRQRAERSAQLFETFEARIVAD